MPFLESNLLLSKLCFFEPFPPRYINSIYYDRSSLSSFEESLNGDSLRTKTRFRWYGKLIQNGQTTLELKKKLGHMSWKVLHKNTFAVNSTSADWVNFISPYSASDVMKKTFFLANKVPTSIVRYKRKYFTSFDRKIRVTIDNDLQFYDQKFTSKPNVVFAKKASSVIVVEMKFQEQNRKMIPNIGKKINFKPMRFSKYCESMKIQSCSLQ